MGSLLALCRDDEIISFYLDGSSCTNCHTAFGFSVTPLSPEPNCFIDKDPEQ